MIRGWARDFPWGECNIPTTHRLNDFTILEQVTQPLYSYIVDDVRTLCKDKLWPPSSHPCLIVSCLGFYCMPSSLWCEVIGCFGVFVGSRYGHWSLTPSLQTVFQHPLSWMHLNLYTFSIDWPHMPMEKSKGMNVTMEHYVYVKRYEEDHEVDMRKRVIG